MIQALVAVLALLLTLPPAAQQSTDVQSHFRRAVELQRSGSLAEAEAEYRALLSLAPDHAEALANLGAVLMRLDRYDEAIAAYESALRQSPGLTPILLNVGIAHYRKGAYERALTALRGFLERSPDSAQGTQLAGLTLIELGRDREAIAYLARAAAQSPADARALYGLGLAYVRLRSLELPALLERLRDLDGGRAPAHLLAGLAHLDRSEFARAAVELEQAAALDRGLPRLHSSMGLAYFRLGRLAEALAAFEEELRRNPRDFTMMYYAAAVREQRGDLAGARDTLRAAAALEPASEEVRTLLERVEGRLARAVAGRENRYVGSVACGSCHTREARTQVASSMARAAFAPRDHPLFEKFRTQSARAADRAFTFGSERQSFEVAVAGGGAETRIPVHWALGAGKHGVTFFSRLGEGKYLEHLFSFYPAAGRLDFTPGQGEQPGDARPGSLGRPNDRAEAFRCLSCHTTGTSNTPDRADLTVGELGVRCEACHGPGQFHVEAVKTEDWETARRQIDNPRRYSARRVLDACGACHREPPVDPARVNWADPGTARFQPMGLSQSACYRNSDGALSCVTCHDAHADAARAPRFYAAKCAGCHTPSSHPPAAQCARAGSGDCVTCHMPRVEAMRHMEFSNHWIGVYPGLDRLVPRRRP